jgi:small conductance mechanosensitive channel
MNSGIDLNALGTEIMTMISTWGLKLLGALVVFIIGRIACGWIRRAVKRALAASKVEETLTVFIGNLTYYAALTLVIIFMLSIVGIETASLAVVLGAAGLAIGLALQGTLANFAAGAMLILFRPIKLGDWVEVAGVSGTVVEIGVFRTSLNSADNVRIIVPNSNVFGQVIKNYNTNDTRRIDLVMGVGYDDDIGRAIEAMSGVIRGDERVLADPEPVIAVSELGDSSVNLVVRPWCRREDYWALRWDLTRAMKEQLEAAGCSIPFPQRDVHLYQAGA